MGDLKDLKPWLEANPQAIDEIMQLGPPGYLDGHHGEWPMPPDRLAEEARLYWNAGYQIHVHVNGDQGIQTTLDVLAKLLDERPRFDHRFTLHHYGFSTSEQARRVAKLGALSGIYHRRVRREERV